jgi:pimeloyl-ACP methyl ester carboxylesterase
MTEAYHRIFAGATMLTLCLSLTSLKADDIPPVTYHTVEVDGLDIFYREAGPQDGPVLLLLHGFPSCSRMYQSLLLSDLNHRYHLIAPDYPGFGLSSWPNHKVFNYTFDHLAQVMQDFVAQLKLTHYSFFLQDYGGPVGFRMADAHPEMTDAIIIQNANSYEVGLSALWPVRRAFWEDRPAHEAALRANFISKDATRQRHVGSSPHPEYIDPENWLNEYYFLNQPGQTDIQLDLFFDYQNNIRLYPTWQKWLREHQPALLVIWGRYDPSFTVAGAEAYGKDVPAAAIHILDAGHFALDQKADEIARLTKDFLDRQKR